MRGEWVDAIRRGFRSGFANGFGYRSRLISGVRASLDTSDFGERHACGYHAVAHYRQDPPALHGLRAPHE